MRGAREGWGRTLAKVCIGPPLALPPVTSPAMRATAAVAAAAPPGSIPRPVLPLADRVHARPAPPSPAHCTLVRSAGKWAPDPPPPRRPLPHLLAAAALAALAAFSPPALAEPTPLEAVEAVDTAAPAAPAPPSTSTSSPSTSASPTKVASFPASGLVFKDTVEVVSLPDPAVRGVVIYITEVRRSLVDKLTSSGGGFFAEPAAASVTCVTRAGPGAGTLVPGADVGGPEGRDIFTERKSLSLVAAKTLRVRRVVDKGNGTVLYVAYNTRLSGPGGGGGGGGGSGGDKASTDGAGGGTGSARYRTSVCALPLAG